MKDIIKQHNLKFLSEENNVDVYALSNSHSDNNKTSDINGTLEIA